VGRQPREREKPCDRCGTAADVLYRVRVAADGPWIFVCRRCWDAVATDNSEYRYGGTWKARKRR
jgi:hypothetical protein